MAVGPSCFVRRETRGLNERLRQGLDCERVWEGFSIFLSLSLFLFFFVLCETVVYMVIIYIYIYMGDNIEEEFGEFDLLLVQCQRLIFVQVISSL